MNPYLMRDPAMVAHLSEIPALAARYKAEREHRERRSAIANGRDPEIECQEDIERYTADAAERLQSYLQMVPSRYAAASLSSLEAKQHGDAIDRWLDEPEGLNLFFAGPAGTGKTHAATATGTGWILRRAAANRPHRLARWWSVPSLLDALRPGRDDETAWRGAVGAGLLVLDDLGHTRATDWAVERMWMLADARVGENLRTVVTTNAAWTALIDTWGSATMDRFRQGSAVLRFAGDSRRKPLW